MPVVLKCDQCGKEFERRPSGVKEHNFCSSECYGKWKSENIRGKDHPLWKEKIELTCKNCGEKFKVVPSNSDKEFCSNTCRYKYRVKTGKLKGKNASNWKGGKVELTCEWCRDKYYVRPSRAENSRFCSRECFSEWEKEKREYPTDENNPLWKEKIKLKCEYCGETYYRKKSEADKSRFCSRECMAKWKSENQTGENNPFWHGGCEGIDYGPNWKEQRKKAMKRDNFECQVCGMENQDYKDLYGQDLDVHHKRPFREFEDYREANKLDNLVTLCRSCHTKIENGVIK